MDEDSGVGGSGEEGCHDKDTDVERNVESSGAENSGIEIENSSSVAAGIDVQGCSAEWQSRLQGGLQD